MLRTQDGAVWSENRRSLEGQYPVAQVNDNEPSSIFRARSSWCTSPWTARAAERKGQKASRLNWANKSGCESRTRGWIWKRSRFPAAFREASCCPGVAGVFVFGVHVLRLDPIWHTSGGIPLLRLGAPTLSADDPGGGSRSKRRVSNSTREDPRGQIANMRHNHAGCVLSSRILSMSQVHVWSILTISNVVSLWS